MPRPALPGGPVSQSRGSASNIGRHGRVEILATRDDSELSWVAVEGNGDILGLTLGGNMGACDVTVNAFMPDGSPVPFFQRQFAALLEHAGPPVFVAVFIVRRSGFLLVGTGQSVPVTPAPSPTAIGQAVAFEPDGSLDMSFAHHGVARFSSRMENPMWALPQPNGGVLIVGQTPYLRAGAKTRVLLDLLGIVELRERRGRLPARARASRVAVPRPVPPRVGNPRQHRNQRQGDNRRQQHGGR